MKSLRLLTLVTLCFAAGAVASGADPKSAPTAPRTALAGEFTGQWRGRNDTGGALRLKFTPAKDADWTAEATFTFEGTDVPTTTKSLRVDGATVELVIAWEVQGTAASSKLTGEWKGDTLEGTYDSTTAEGAGTGTWKVTRAPKSP